MGFLLRCRVLCLLRLHLILLQEVLSLLFIHPHQLGGKELCAQKVDIVSLQQLHALAHERVCFLWGKLGLLQLSIHLAAVAVVRQLLQALHL